MVAVCISLFTGSIVYSNESNTGDIPLSIALLMVVLFWTGIIFLIRFLNKNKARALKEFADKYGYSFSSQDGPQFNVSEKIIGLKGKVPANIVNFIEEHESYFVFSWENSKREEKVCLIETKIDFNCNILVLPLGMFPGVMKDALSGLIRMIRGPEFEKVEIDKAEFDNKFTVYSDNKSVCVRLLNDKVIEHTLRYWPQFKAGSMIWLLEGNNIAVCTRRLRSVEEVEGFIEYAKELKVYLADAQREMS